MSTEIAVNTTGTALTIPAGLAAAFGDVESNISVGESIPHISIKGKVWKVVIEGSEKVMMMKDEDGEETPKPTIKVLILNQVQKRSRAYFPDDYVEGINVQPSCWSVDGKTPDSQVNEPQAVNCEKCEQAAKGSKINSNGDATTACGVHKRICVVPSSKPDFVALLVKLPVTSLWEKEGSEQAQGWFAYDAYMKYLKANNVPHTALIETIMKFDSKDVSYPKVLFKQNGLISEEKAAIVGPRVNSEEVLNVLGVGENSQATNTNSKVDTLASESNDEDKEKIEAEAAKVAKAEKAAKAKAAKAEKAAKAKAAKAEKAAAEKETITVATVEDEEDLSDVLDDWD